MKNRKICVLGSLNIDMTVTMQRFHLPGETVTGKDFSVFPGGKGGNQAVAAARLGADVTMVGCIGEDTNGKIYLDTLRKNGINDDYVRIIPNVPTGTALIEVDEKGENRIVVIPGANQQLTTDVVTESLDALLECGVLLLQLEVPVESVTHAAAIAKRMGVYVVLDPAPARPLSDALLVICDYITPNEHELSTITGLPAGSDEEAIAACAELIRRGAKAVINKRGKRGAILVTGAGARMIPGYTVEAVDTTAAGDTFNAGFAAGLTLGMTPEDAIRLANGAAAISTTGMGAQSAMPSLDDACSLVELGTM